MDDDRLASVLGAAYDSERTLWTCLLGTTDNPAEVAETWRAYRHAVGLRKSLERVQRERATTAQE